MLLCTRQLTERLRYGTRRASTAQCHMVKQARLFRIEMRVWALLPPVTHKKRDLHTLL
jgi:hypothetical protein